MKASLRPVEGAETAQRLGARLLGREAATHELLDAHVEMESEFLVDVALEPCPPPDGEPEEAADAGADASLVHSRAYAVRGVVRMPVTVSA